MSAAPVVVRSDRRYTVQAAPTALWAALSRVEDYPRWWPWLSDLDAGALDEGARWACTIKPPVPYTLRLRIHLVEVDAPRLIVAAVEGDIAGEARLDIEADGAGSTIHLVSALSPANPMLATVALLARPLVVFGHDWVLRTGFRQFTTRAL